MADYNLFDVFSKTADQLFRDVDLSPAMIYLIDTVNANALPFLAKQFDVEGFKGWSLATTEQQKREIIKTAIEIKKHLGTPYAIRRALEAMGFGNVTFQEGEQVGGDAGLYDGSQNYDGTLMFGGFNWAAFTVTISVQDPGGITDETKALIRELILYYKNARSLLIDVIYESDGISYFDGTYNYDSTITY